MKSGFRQVCVIVLVFLFFSGTALAANYVVSGAPDSDANGVYVQDGTRDGVPKYSKEGYSHLYRQEDGSHSWAINFGYGHPHTMTVLVYTNPSNSDRPPKDGWQDPFDNPVDLMTITLDPSSIPSLSTWGVLIMLSLLIGIAIRVIRKKNFSDTAASA